MKPNDNILNRYSIIDCLSDAGGMGCVMKALDINTNQEVAIKYFRDSIDDSLKERFRREVRLMQSMEGSPMVVTVIDANLDFDPPFFVMPIYRKGDLSAVSNELSNDYEAQRSLLNTMCDAVDSLHVKGHLHRDIKPANFLRDNDNNIVISDLGFALDPNSSTRQTLSKEGWGTEGYTPPEFRQPNGFKGATFSADIFMLGKAFYQVLTGRDPLFVDPTAIEKPIYYVIEKCCRIKEQDRYQSIAELKSALKIAFDHLTGTLDSTSKARAIFEKIQMRLQKLEYQSDEVNEFINLSLALSNKEFLTIIREAKPQFFSSIAQEVFAEQLPAFLKAYDDALHSESMNYSYAETVADNMRSVFNTSQDEDGRLKALKIAVYWANSMNRYDAMGTCSTIVTSIKSNDSIAHGVVALIGEMSNTFLTDVEASECRNPLIANALRQQKKS